MNADLKQALKVNCAKIIGLVNEKTCQKRYASQIVSRDNFWLVQEEMATHLELPIERFSHRSDNGNGNSEEDDVTNSGKKRKKGKVDSGAGANINTKGYTLDGNTTGIGERVVAEMFSEELYALRQDPSFTGSEDQIHVLRESLNL